MKMNNMLNSFDSWINSDDAPPRASNDVARELEEVKAEAEKRINHLEEDNTQKARKLRETTNKVTELQELNTKLGDTVKKLEGEIGRLKEKLADMEQNWSQSNQISKEQSHAYAKAEEQIQTLKAELAATKTELVEAQAQLQKKVDTTIPHKGSPSPQSVVSEAVDEEGEEREGEEEEEEEEAEEKKQQLPPPPATTKKIPQVDVTEVEEWKTKANLFEKQLQKAGEKISVLTDQIHQLKEEAEEAKLEEEKQSKMSSMLKGTQKILSTLASEDGKGHEPAISRKEYDAMLVERDAIKKEAERMASDVGKVTTKNKGLLKQQKQDQSTIEELKSQIEDYKFKQKEWKEIEEARTRREGDMQKKIKSNQQQLQSKEETMKSLQDVTSENEYLKAQITDLREALDCNKKEMTALERDAQLRVEKMCVEVERIKLQCDKKVDAMMADLSLARQAGEGDDYMQVTSAVSEATMPLLEQIARLEEQLGMQQDAHTHKVQGMHLEWGEKYKGLEYEYNKLRGAHSETEKQVGELRQAIQKLEDCKIQLTEKLSSEKCKYNELFQTVGQYKTENSLLTKHVHQARTEIQTLLKKPPTPSPPMHRPLSGGYASGNNTTKTIAATVSSVSEGKKRLTQQLPHLQHPNQPMQGGSGQSNPPKMHNNSPTTPQPRGKEDEEEGGIQLPASTGLATPNITNGEPDQSTLQHMLQTMNSSKESLRDELKRYIQENNELKLQSTQFAMLHKKYKDLHYKHNVLLEMMGEKEELNLELKEKVEALSKQVADHITIKKAD